MNITGLPLGFIAVDFFEPATSVTVDGFTLAPGQGRYLTPRFSPSNANMVSHAWNSYTSSNTNVATVNAGGRVSANNPGTAVITVTNKITRVTATATVTVQGTVLNARILYDQTHRGNRTQTVVHAGLQNVFSTATRDFLNVFDIRFNLESVSQYTGSTVFQECPWTEPRHLCSPIDGRCGPLSQCVTQHRIAL